MKNIPESAEMTYWAGYSHSRLGKELCGGLVLEKARVELRAAIGLLERALKPPEELRSSQERQLNAMCYRAIVLTYDQLIQLIELERLRGLPRLASDGSRSDYLESLSTFLSRWVGEHPDDSFAQSELARFETKYGIRVD